MTSAQIRIFSSLAADSHNSSYGVTALLGATTTITIVCQPLTDLELATGGFEANGAMKALVSGVTIPNLHDRLTIASKTWVVRKKVENIASVEYGLFLEAVPS